MTPLPVRDDRMSASAIPRVFGSVMATDTQSYDIALCSGVYGEILDLPVFIVIYYNSIDADLQSARPLLEKV